MMHGSVVSVLTSFKLCSVQSEGFENLSGSYTSLDNPEQFESKKMLKETMENGIRL